MRNNVDRTYQNLHDHMNQLRATMTQHRKQIHKYKAMNNKLEADIKELETGNSAMNRIN